RLDADSKIRLEKISEVPIGEQVIEKRRLILEHGSLRIRVRKNVARPAPVLVIGVGADVLIGRGDLNGPGGVDVLIHRTRGDDRGTVAVATVQVLNGSAYLSRKGILERGADDLVLPRGRTITVPALKKAMPVLSSLPILKEEDLKGLITRYGFSNEQAHRKALVPERHNRELDGP
ncbi:MAG: hypothetical protein ACYTGH_17245, partial [Planctomycetota bacterium]